MSVGIDARRLPDGRLAVPMRAEGPDGVIGDGVSVIGPDHELFAAWDAYLRDAEGDSDDPTAGSAER